MNTKKLLATVAAGMLLAAITASAQIPAAFNDIVLSFSTAGATNVEVNLGHNLQTSGAGTYNLGNLGGFLSNSTTGYGAGWATNSALTFAAVGWTGTAAQGGTSTLFATGAWTTPSGTLGVSNSDLPFNGVITTGSANTVGGKVGSFYNAMTDASATVLSANAISMPAGTAGSFDKSVTSGLNFGKFDPFAFNQSITNNNGFYAAADLYRYTAGQTAVFLGTLALDTAGNLSFTVVPEPSTYAAILGVMTMGIVVIRRRRSSAQLAEIA